MLMLHMELETLFMLCFLLNRPPVDSANQAEALDVILQFVSFITQDAKCIDDDTSDDWVQQADDDEHVNKL